MGIRYCAYAFDAARTGEAISDPMSIMSADPLADAWGIIPDAGVATFRQRSSERDLLYLDKAWLALQRLSGPSRLHPAGRPSYRMFEGSVTMRAEGWTAWLRAIRPDEIPEIADDLRRITDREAARMVVESSVRHEALERQIGYVRQFLDRARSFADGLVEDGRGLVYKIG